MITRSESAKGNEQCALCDRTVPQGSVVLRKHENSKIICIPCLVEIAEMTIRTPVTVSKEDANRIKPDVDEPKTK